MPLRRGHAVVGAEPFDEVADVGVADAVAQRATVRSVSASRMRACCMRRSVIHCYTARPVLRRTTVVGWPGESTSSAATWLSEIRVDGKVKSIGPEKLAS
jgi:hypothetical protein